MTNTELINRKASGEIMKLSDAFNRINDLKVDKNTNL